MEEKDGYPKPIKYIGWSFIIIILILSVWSLLIILPPILHQAPIKVVVNPTKARVVEFHASEDASSTIFHFHEAVFATVLNEGGNGKVLVKATLKQGENTYTRSEDAFIQANQTKEFHFVFTEPARLGGDFTYSVSAEPMN